MAPVAVAGSAGPGGRSKHVHPVIDILTQRVFYDVVGRPFLRGMTLPLLVFVLCVTFLDASADWAESRRVIANLSPWQQAIVFSVLIGGWSVQAGRALRPAWRNRTVAFLVRQPIGRIRWAVGLLPSLSIAFVPVAAIWWLAPHRAGAVVHHLAFVGLAWPLILGASYRGARGFVLMAAATLSLAVMVYVYAYAAWWAYLAMLVSVVQLPLGTAWIPRQVAPAHERVTGRLAGSGAIVTLLRRDLRCAFRSGLKPFLNLAVLGFVAAAMMFAFRVNGGVEGREALLAACVLFSIGAAPAYEILERMKSLLGEEVMRRRWPVTFAQRSVALLGLVATLVVPCGLLVAVAGSTMGGAHVASFALFVAVTVTLCAAIYAALLARTRSAVGLYYLALLVHGVIMLALPGWGYAMFAAVVLFVGFVTTANAFAAFAGRMQRMRVGRTA